MKKPDDDADAALRKEKEYAASAMKMYETIVESAPDPIFIQTEEKFAYLNPAACDFFGIDAPEALIGTEVVDIFLPEYREHVRSRFSRLNSDRQPLVNFVEYRFHRKDGKTVWSETKGVPIDYGGKSGVLVFMRDTTPRHAAEEALRKSESKYETLFNQATVPSLLVKWPELDIVEVNDAWVKLLEFGREEVIGRSSDDLGITRMTPEISRSMAEFKKKGFTENVELIIHTKSGKELTVIANVHLLEISGSCYAIITSTDITQRKTAERQLYEISEKFRKSFDFSAIGMWLTDLDGVIFEVNRKACEIFGYTKEELEGKHYSEITFPDDTDMSEAHVRQLLLGDKKSISFDKRYVRKNGEVFWCYIVSTILTDAEGKPLNLITQIQDITKRKRAEESLRRSEQKYTALFKESMTPANLARLSDSTILEVNDAWVQLFGYTREEAVGKSGVDLGGIPAGPVREQFLYAFARQETVRSVEMEMITKGREKLTVLFNARVLEYDDEKLILFTYMDITERKKAEVKLFEISEKFRKTFDYSAIAMSLIDLNGVIENINNKMRVIFGCTETEMVGKRIRDITYPDDFPSAFREIKKLLSGEAQSISFEKRYIRKNGEVFWAIVTSALLMNMENKPVKIITQIQDITDRKIMEEELISRQRFNQIVMDNLPIGISVNSFRPPLSFAYMNDNFPKFYRTTREALSGTDVFFDAVYEDPEFRQAIRGRVLDGMRSGDPERMRWENIPITRKGSETRYISAYNAVVLDEDIQISIVTDETERVLALQALERNAVRFRTLHEFDQAVIKGFESYERIGETALAYIFELIDPDKAGIALFHIENRRIEAVTGKKGSMEYLYTTLAMADGEEELYRRLTRAALYDLAEISDKQLAASIGRIFDIDGRVPGLIRPLYSPAGPIGILYIGRSEGGFSQPDREMLPEIGFQCAMAIEQKRLQLLSEHYANDLEEMIRQRTTQLEAAVNELEAFTYTVSHDLRAPLRSMSGFVRILLEDYGSLLDDEGKRVCGIIEGSAHQMGRLIDDLLALSRIGRSSLVIIPVNMTSMVRSIFNELTTEAQRAEMTFSVGRLPKAAVDPTLIRQVWMNLLDNAIKFSSKKQAPRIRVEGRDGGDEVVFSVSDNGAGFDMQFKDQLFGVFQRLHSNKEFDGTGVGLAIVERIIRRHSGRVWAEGKVDTGATFYFSIKKETVSDDTGSD